LLRNEWCEIGGECPQNVGQRNISRWRCRFRIFWQTDCENCGRFGAISQAFFALEVASPVGRSVEIKESSSLEDAG
jgi:hypothetical protein